MGTKVKQGDLLAEIETPEIDAQLRQAEADVKTAEANSKLAQLTAQRWKSAPEDGLRLEAGSRREDRRRFGKGGRPIFGEGQPRSI